MTQKPFDPKKAREMMKAIHKGMDVVDTNRETVGKVDQVYFGSDTSEQSSGQGGLLENVVRSLTGDDRIPEVLRQRLLREGYLRIDGAGLFTGHSYVLPEQIDIVASEKVGINVTREELIKA